MFRVFRSFANIVKQNIEYFPRIFMTAKVDFFKNNSGTDLGWIWNILKPMMYVGMFYVAITLGIRHAKDIDGIVCPYIIWLATGIFAWFYLSKAILGGGACFKKNKTLIFKANYPVLVIPMIPGTAALWNHFFMVGFLVIMATLSGVKPTVYWLQIPFYTILMYIFAYVWSLLTGLCTVLSADFLNFIRSIRPAFFWLSGIFFNSRAEGRDPLMFLFNPITYLIEGYRNCICYNMWFWENMKGLGAFTLVLSVLTVLALALYHRLRRVLPEII